VTSLPFPVEETTIAAVQEAFLAGTLTSRTLVQAYLDRIAAYDKVGPAINAIVTINDKALAEADRLDAALAKSGALSGPLHGIPVVVKDQAETAGIETTFGSIAFDGNIPTEDATIIAKLKAAGAIILAKTAMPDFATSWFGYSSKIGMTKNPYDLARDPGGSSGGTGAAVASNFGLVGIGEDTGGSIRVPACFNNLFGVRVTPGLISRAGLSPLVVFQDTAGPMARTVTDTAILLDALVGYDAKDPYTVAYTIAGHQGSYTQHLDGGALKGMRIGVLKEAFGSDDDPDAAPVNAVVRAALAKVASAGAVLIDVSLPDIGRLIDESSLYLLRSRHDINKFLAARPQLAYPTVEAIHAAGKFHPLMDLFVDLVKGPTVPEEDPTYYPKYAVREIFQRAVVNLMAQHDLTGIAFPDVQVLSPRKADIESGKWNTLTFPTNTLIASQTWMPAISVPAGFSPDGVPVGLEFVALPYREPDLFRFGYAFEQLTHTRKAPASSSAG
jgi:Asp-tRNA(Asn)/Glu-tRNA(Gln) amidotransferase A subunit family amidase